MSTIRGHSVSNSLSSVVSSRAASPSRAKIARQNLTTTVEDDGTSSRPSTAGAVLDIKERSKDHLRPDLFHRKRPISVAGSDMAITPGSTSNPPSPNIAAKRKSWLRFDQRHSSKLHMNNSDPSLPASSTESLPASPGEEVTLDEALDVEEKRSSKHLKSQKKPRKVKSWANTIISRKAWHHSHKKTREVSPPTPPRPASANLEEIDFSTLFDGDNTITIVTTSDEVERPILDTSIVNWRPKQFAQQDLGDMSPVIDLDAALGPLATPSAYSRGHSRGVSVAKRSMHSSAGLGFGFQNHRRAESAPALAQYEGHSSVLAGRSAMTDVFEEEEEDEAAQSPKSKVDKASDITLTAKDTEQDEERSIGIQIVEADDSNAGTGLRWNFDDGLGIRQNGRGRNRTPIRDVSPSPILGSRDETPVPPMSRGPAVVRGSSPVEVVEDYEEPRTSSITRSSDSTVTPTIPAQDPKDQQPLMNLSLPLPQHALLTPDTLTNSSFSSPDFGRNQDSFDYPRLGTATSSVADNRATSSSLALGEPGPELRPSVDDTPSLTSSRSTMTSAAHAHFHPPFTPRGPGERTSSVSSAPSVDLERRKKRASIVSLSRLIGHGGSFGERSKLHIEQRPQSEHMQLSTETKQKKSKRISKLMQFWKSKESKKSKDSCRA